jgi:TusA-related sulfurtransferase
MTMNAQPIPRPSEPTQQASERHGPRYALDLRGVPCPLNLVKAKLAIEKVALGDILEIEIDDGEPIQNVPVSLSRQGQEILETTKCSSYFCLKVRRRL